MFHVRLDVDPWGPDGELQRLDAAMRTAGSKELHIPMSRMPLEEDGDHFTHEGQRMFSRALADALPPNIPGPLLILADSTVDFHNWSDDGTWNGWASALLKDTLGRDDVTVDCVCGSGFIARSAVGEHFRARMSHHLRRDGTRVGNVILVGGWNDHRTGRIDDTIRAMHGFISLWQRYR